MFCHMLWGYNFDVSGQTTMRFNMALTSFNKIYLIGFELIMEFGAARKTIINPVSV